MNEIEISIDELLDAVTAMTIELSSYLSYDSSIDVILACPVNITTRFEFENLCNHIPKEK